MTKELDDALETPIVGCRDLTAEDERVINTLYKAAKAYSALPKKLEGMMLDRELFEPNRDAWMKADGYNDAIIEITKHIKEGKS